MSEAFYQPTKILTLYLKIMSHSPTLFQKSPWIPSKPLVTNPPTPHFYSYINPFPLLPNLQLKLTPSLSLSLIHIH